MVRLLVLGLLKIKPLSGYEIQQILQTNQTDIWGGVLPGSIYHALKKMDKEGLVAVDSVEQTGHRIKAIYKITDKGLEEFRQLILEGLREKSVQLPGTLYSALSFIHELPKEARLQALKDQKESLEKDLSLLKEGIHEKEQAVTVDALSRITFENMFQHYELQIDLVTKLLNEIEKEGEEQNPLSAEDLGKYFE